MAFQTWQNLLNGGPPWQTTQGAALTTSASTATISPQAVTGQDFVLPGQPNGLQFYPGMTLRVKARGVLSTAGTTSNLTVFLACGVSGTLASTLTSTAALVMGATTITGVPWRLEASVNCVAIGSSGTTLESEGEIIMADVATPAFVTASAVMVGLPYTALALNTYTTGTALGLRATYSAAFGSIQCNQFTIEQLC